jgi:TetR/AcrR family transcriptional regulator, cholesterol catabolism regulator
MASAGASRAERSARRLSEITDAAAKVFARLGYHGSSTQDIADVLGMRQASLYYYFGSKEAALEAVCVNGAEDYAGRADSILKTDAACSEKVASLVLQHVAPQTERRDYTLAFLRERRFLPRPARDRVNSIVRRYERLVERVIDDGVARGEFRKDLDTRMATLALLGLGTSAALWYGREPGTTVERIARSYIDILVRGFRAGS